MTCSTPLTSWTRCLGDSNHLAISLQHFRDSLTPFNVGSSVSYFSWFPVSQLFLSVWWSVFWCFLENSAWEVCFFFLFVTLHVQKWMYSILIIWMMFYVDILVQLGILSRQEFEDIALLLSSFQRCQWEIWRHSDSWAFENNLFPTLLQRL